MNGELIGWDDSFLVNNVIIDRQHQELVRMTNEFYAACQRGNGLTKVYFLKTIQGAINYAKTHFTTEEDIMLKAGYPELAEHQKQHKDFSVNIMEQVRTFEKNGTIDPASLVKILGEWIRDHIAGSDRKYAPYIRNVK